mgnify:CR=1 FL=1
MVSLTLLKISFVAANTKKTMVKELFETSFLPIHLDLLQEAENISSLKRQGFTVDKTSSTEYQVSKGNTTFKVNTHTKKVTTGFWDRNKKKLIWLGIVPVLATTGIYGIWSLFKAGLDNRSYSLDDVRMVKDEYTKIKGAFGL